VGDEVVAQVGKEGRLVNVCCWGSMRSSSLEVASPVDAFHQASIVRVPWIFAVGRERERHHLFSVASPTSAYTGFSFVAAFEKTN
tara:strand:+ start:94 stop:348 length:255 start_codon:yes stop_codon:yes gene_type:complete